jgi:HK97 family phage prohead protease
MMTTPAPRSAPATGAALTRAAMTLPATYDEADNSVEVIWTTGAPVARYDFAVGDYDELLSTDPGAVRLDRLNAGGPVLAVHDRHSLAGVVGSIVPGSARMTAGQGIARIRLAETPDAADIVAKVKAGHIRSVSIGYAVHAYEAVPTPDGARPQMRATDWEPFEVSLVPIPADPGAHIRSMENSMTTPSNLPTTTPAASPGKITAAMIRQRVSASGMSESVALDLVERNDATPFTPETLTSEIGQRFATSQAPIQRQHISIGIDHGERLQARMADALFARLSGRAPAPEAREFMGLSMIGMARELMESRGEHVRRLSDVAIAERAMAGTTTSDFKNLLSNSGNKFLLDSFALAESAIKTVARQRTAADFRTLNILKLGGAPLLDRVGEAGEIKYGAPFEGSETYRLETFAKIFAISRQALINDDLGAFGDPLRLMARGAAETEAAQLAALLNANSGAGPVMSDTFNLYSTQHGNVAGAGAAISVTTLGTARQAMRDQFDLDGVTRLNCMAKTLLVGSAQETLAQQNVALLTPNQTSSVNPFAGALAVAVDPRLTGTSWRLFADPAEFPVIEYCYLNGGEGPQLTTREGWDVLGMEFRVVLDFGCGIVDHRGTYRNPGA